MAEYIEREALNIAIHKSWQNNPHNDPIVRRTHNNEHRHFLCLLHQQPAADVVEVRHGEWVGDNNMRLNLPTLLEYDDWHCSECGSYYPEGHISRLSNYCPDCGAKMDGKGEGE